jgi:branched-chain amino acid transport system substrate-binding protein
VNKLVALGFAALLAVTASVPARAATVAGDPVEIDALVPSTGPGAFLAKSYLDTFRAIEIVVNHSGGIAGHPLHIVTSDSQTSGATGLQLVNALVAKHAALFVDGGPSTVCNASVPLVAKTGPVDYCLSPLIKPESGSYVFSASASGTDFVRVGVRYFRERGWKRIAIVAANDASGQAYELATNAALALAENAGVQIVAREHFNGSDLNIGAQISRVAAAAPQAILIYATGPAVATVLHGMHDAALDLPVQISSSNMIYAQLATYAGFAPTNVFFPTTLALTPADTPAGPIRDAQTAYVAAFSAIGVRPDFANNLAWDPTMILVAALRKSGALADAQTVRDDILNLHGWVGVNGVYDFGGGDQRGIGENAIEVARWIPATNTFVRASRPRGYLLSRSAPQP